MLEVELLDDSREPRDFSDTLLKVRIFKKCSVQSYFNVDFFFYLGSRTNHKSREWNYIYDGEIPYGWYGNST